MSVDSFKFLPRLISTFYQMTEREPELPIPWTPLPSPISECKFGLVTSGGLYHRGIDLPFDLERERREPTWGDPTYRVIPSEIQQENVGISHLHFNTNAALSDFNILLPIHRFRELVEESCVGSLANEHYSFMGYQGFPQDTTAWRETYGPQVTEKLKAEGVDCVLLTPVWPDCSINVPVLARVFEAAGLSTILVTMMPYWAERVGVPRTLAVEFPFGHTLGRPHDVEGQMRVIQHAISVLQNAQRPGTIVHATETWPASLEEALDAWQPTEPSPIITELSPRIREMLRERRAGKK